jgi:hypothetical protein
MQKIRGHHMLIVLLLTWTTAALMLKSIIHIPSSVVSNAPKSSALLSVTGALADNLNSDFLFPNFNFHRALHLHEVISTGFKPPTQLDSLLNPRRSGV